MILEYFQYNQCVVRVRKKKIRILIMKSLKVSGPAAWVGRCGFVVVCYRVLISRPVAPGSLAGRRPTVLLLVSGSVFTDQPVVSFSR